MHESVLLKESIEALKVAEGKKFIDATLGAGGHSLEIAKAGGRVLGIEADPRMLEIAKDNLSLYTFGTQPILILGNFRNIDRLAYDNGFESCDGILMDLGISSVHLDGDPRGFSFKDHSAALDMRLNPENQGVTAADLLNSLDETQLTKLFESRSLARKAIEFRKVRGFQKVGYLLSLTGDKRVGKIHPATVPFMNLRIAVNSEIDTLTEALPKAYKLLGSGGKLAVITFHSGEDRVVKDFFRDKGGGFVTPSSEEVARNPRARSAKLRYIEK